MENKTTTYVDRRNNFMETFKGDEILTKRIPEIAAGLMKREFGVNIYDHSNIPIVFSVGWTEILKSLASEQLSECRVNVCGASLEYVTEESESDKSTNIVPQMYHIKTPIFNNNDVQSTIGVAAHDELNARYNAWRSVSNMEAIVGIENKIFDIILKDFGVNLMTAAAIYPTMAATYVAGITIARETKQTVNMYNIFEIDVVEGDKILLTPLATIKQWLKDDSKKL